MKDEIVLIVPYIAMRDLMFSQANIIFWDIAMHSLVAVN
jgi:hypothetical protein